MEDMVLHTITPQPHHRKALANWSNLNTFLKNCNLDDCRVLLRLEDARGFEARPSFIRRINGRYRKVQKNLRLRG